jgi:hydrogenase/urease accessory protein HupE
LNCTVRHVLTLLALGLTLCVLCSTTHAHEVRPAYLQIEEQAPNHFDALWKQPGQGELMLRLEPVLSNGLLEGPPDEIYATGDFVIRHWKDRELPKSSFEGATVRIECLERTLTDALVHIRFASGQEIQSLLKPAEPSFQIELTGTSKRAVPAYLALGIEHILTGFDHLSFVLGLVLLVRGRVKLLTTITAFTVAHSITLAAAALGHVKPNSAIVETLVALSIVFVAVELARAGDGRAGLAIRYPQLIAFAFGLLHGLAFSGFLGEIGLPEHNVPGALFLFNLGVEIGQLLFVGVVLTVMALLRQWQRAPSASRYARALVTYGIGVFASYWMFERMFGVVQ